MKKLNLTIIATIMATFVISMIVIQPTATEASNNVVPNMTPSPRKIRTIPAPTPSPITKVKAKKPAYKEGGVNDTTFRTRKSKIKKPNNFQEISGIGMEVNARSKKTRRNSAQYNPKEIGVGKIKAKKPISFTSAEGRSMSFELRKKQPRKRNK